MNSQLAKSGLVVPFPHGAGGRLSSVVYDQVGTSFRAALHAGQPFLPRQHWIETFGEPRLKRFCGRVGQPMARLA